MRRMFVDFTNEGHHYAYNSAVMQGMMERMPSSEILYYSQFSDPEKKTKLVEAGVQVEEFTLEAYYQRLPAMLVRIILVFKALQYSKKNGWDNIHFLYLDTIILPLCILYPFLLNTRITATLHWFPGRRSKRKLLGILLNKKLITKLIVHGEYIKTQVEEITSRGTIYSVIYPNLHPLDSFTSIKHLQVKERLFTPSNKGYVLLSFGGLRHDKGIDILLKAAEGLNDLEFTIVIAGKEDSFNKAYLEENIRKYKLENKVVMNLEYITDEDVSSYFDLADFIVLPYRKVFSGQSGPLTEGAIRSKIIIGPNHGEIGDTIQRYELGVVFEAENSSDLGKKIRDSIHNHDDLKRKIHDSNYKQLIQVGEFIKNYLLFFLKEENQDKVLDSP